MTLEAWEEEPRRHFLRSCDWPQTQVGTVHTLGHLRPRGRESWHACFFSPWGRQLLLRTTSSRMSTFQAESTHPTKQKGKEADFSSTAGRGCRLLQGG